MTTDRDGNRSNPYRPDPAQCCEACVFGRGVHADFCKGWVIKRAPAEEYCQLDLRSLMRDEFFSAFGDGPNPFLVKRDDYGV